MTDAPTAVVKVRDLSGGRLSRDLGKRLVYGAESDTTGLGATVSEAVSIDRPKVREVYDEAVERYDPDGYEDGDVLARVTLADDDPEVEWAEDNPL